MGSALAYTSARILLFVAATGVLYLVGARGLLLIALALVVSGIVSFIVLSAGRHVGGVHRADPRVPQPPRRGCPGRG